MKTTMWTEVPAKIRTRHLITGCDDLLDLNPLRSILILSHNIHHGYLSTCFPFSLSNQNSLPSSHHTTYPTYFIILVISYHLFAFTDPSLVQNHRI